MRKSNPALLFNPISNYNWPKLSIMPPKWTWSSIEFNEDVTTFRDGVTTSGKCNGTGWSGGGGAHHTLISSWFSGSVHLKKGKQGERHKKGWPNTYGPGLHLRKGNVGQKKILQNDISHLWLKIRQLKRIEKEHFCNLYYVINTCAIRYSEVDKVLLFCSVLRWGGGVWDFFRLDLKKKGGEAGLALPPVSF